MLKSSLLHFIYYFLVMELQNVLSQQQQQQQQNMSAEAGSGNSFDWRSFTVEKKYLDAYLGWPYVVSCNLLMHLVGGDITGQMSSFFHFGNFYEQITCKIWDENGVLRYNETFRSGELEELRNDFGLKLSANNTLTDFTIKFEFPDKFQRERGAVTKIQLNLKEFKEESCEWYINHIQHENKSPVPLNKAIVHMEFPDGDRILPRFFKSDGMTYHWQRNCSTIPNKTNLETSSEKFKIESISFADAGIYTLSATYNGMTRYIYNKILCVKHSTTDNKLSLVCETKSIYSLTGKDVVFTCHANFGEGMPDTNGLSITWEKVNSGQTATHCSSIKEKGKKEDSAIDCTYEISKSSCFVYVPSKAEQESPKAIATIKLNILNVQDKDYGDYSISVKTNRVPTESKIITLKPDPDLLTKAQIVGLCIGILFSLLIFLGIAFYFRIYIRVYFKRYIRAYISDENQYDAFFVYEYSEDIDQFAQDKMKVLVSQLQSVFNELGFRVYDERKDGFHVQDRAENIRFVIEKSHRVVILLTLDFIKDGWSMFALQNGFDGMIQSGSKLIFLLPPGIKEYLKQHSKQNSTYQMIQRAMKLNYVLKWSDSEKQFNKKRFKWEVEDAMPKLKPRQSEIALKSSNEHEESLLRLDERACDIRVATV